MEAFKQLNDREYAKGKLNWAFSLRLIRGFLVMGESSLYSWPSSYRDGPANSSKIIQWGFLFPLQIRNCAFNSALENLRGLHALDLSFPPPLHQPNWFICSFLTLL